MISTPFNQLPRKKKFHIAAKFMNSLFIYRYCSVELLIHCNFDQKRLNPVNYNNLVKCIYFIDLIPNLLKSRI